MVFRLSVLLLEKWREGSEKSWQEESSVEPFPKMSGCPALPVITVSKVQTCSQQIQSKLKPGGKVGQPAELLHQPGHLQSLLHHQPGNPKEGEGHCRLLFPVTFYTLLSTVDALNFEETTLTNPHARNVTMRTFESLSHCNITYTRVDSFADFSVKNAR